MNSGALPPELHELESRLRGRFSPGASADLRFRIMHVVGSDLSFQAQTSSGRTSDRWYWAAIAAAGIIAMNLSLIDSSRTELSGRASISQSVVNVEPMWRVSPLEPGAFK
ncbi:MAG: hypothetical protein ABR964_01765 [Tepidisphaeraceae bacterium]|jgi:hypothetical protein